MLFIIYIAMLLFNWRWYVYLRGECRKVSFMNSLVFAADIVIHWRKRYFICATLLMVLAQQSSANEITLSPMYENIRGKCKTIHKANFSEFSSKADISIVYSIPSPIEFRSYNSLPATITEASPGLGIGNVKCRPTAAAWASSTGNTWQLPASHPRNNKTMCVEVSLAAGRTPSKFYDSTLMKLDQFYVMYAKKAIIHEAGILGLHCGYVQLHEGCETIFKFLGRKWYQKCKGSLDKNKMTWDSLFSSNVSQNRWADDMKAAMTPCLGYKEVVVKRAAKVFVITAGWDGNYHHFLSDGLSRLIRYKDFLRENPDIMIHIRKSEQFAKKLHYKEASRRCRERLLHALAIDTNRIISGTVVADEVYLPKSTKCNEPQGHGLELRSVVFCFNFVYTNN